MLPSTRSSNSNGSTDERACILHVAYMYKSRTLHETCRACYCVTDFGTEGLDWTEEDLTGTYRGTLVSRLIVDDEKVNTPWQEDSLNRRILLQVSVHVDNQQGKLTLPLQTSPRTTLGRPHYPCKQLPSTLTSRSIIATLVDLLELDLKDELRASRNQPTTNIPLKD